MVGSWTSAGEAPGLEEHARQVLLRVKGAFAGVVNALPGRITRPHELSKALKIDTKLAWKVMKVAHGADVFAAAQYIPGAAATRLFLEAAATKDISSARIQDAEAALAEFEQLVDLHGDDRPTLEMMLLSFTREGRSQADLAYRKAAFAANTYIWGAQARTHFKADFVHPAGEKGRLDFVTLRGFIGLRRMRPDVAWVIDRARLSNDDGTLRRRPIREPLDPAQDTSEAGAETPLVREFCSAPLPAVRRVKAPDGFYEDELAPGGVGNTGAVTCITGEVLRNAASQYSTEHDRWATHAVLMRTPCQELHFDLFVHEDLFGVLKPELAVYSQLAGGPPVLPLESRERDRLLTWEWVEYLGKGPSVVHAPHVPRYTEMIGYTLEKLGWDGKRFDVYRVRMQYPVIPSSVLVTYELPEALAE